MHPEAVMVVFVIVMAHWTITSENADNHPQPWTLGNDAELVCPNRTYPYWIDDLGVVGCFNFTMTCMPLRSKIISKVTERPPSDQKLAPKDNFHSTIKIIIAVIAIIVTSVLTILALAQEGNYLATMGGWLSKRWYMRVKRRKDYDELLKLIDLDPAEQKQLCYGVIKHVIIAAKERPTDGKKLCQWLSGKPPEGDVEAYITKSLTEWRDGFKHDTKSDMSETQQMLEVLFKKIYVHNDRHAFYFPSLKDAVKTYLEDFGDGIQEKQGPTNQLEVPSNAAPAGNQIPDCTSSQPDSEQAQYVGQGAGADASHLATNVGQTSNGLPLTSPSSPSSSSPTQDITQTVIIPHEHIMQTICGGWVDIKVIGDQTVTRQQIFSLLDYLWDPQSLPCDYEKEYLPHVRGYYSHRPEEYFTNTFTVQFAKEEIAKFFGQQENQVHEGVEYSFTYRSTAEVQCNASGFPIHARNMVENAVLIIEYTHLKIGNTEIQAGIRSATLQVADPSIFTDTLEVHCPEIGLVKKKCNAVISEDDGDVNLESNSCPPPSDKAEASHPNVATTHNSVDQPPQDNLIATPPGPNSDTHASSGPSAGVQKSQIKETDAPELPRAFVARPVSNPECGAQTALLTSAMPACDIPVNPAPVKQTENDFGSNRNPIHAEPKGDTKKQEKERLLSYFPDENSKDFL